MESNALEKSTNNIVAWRFFERTPRIRPIVKIVDLGRYGCKGYTSVVISYSEVTLLFCFGLYGIAVSGQYVVEFPGLPYFWGYFVKPCCFPIFNFS